MNPQWFGDSYDVVKRFFVGNIREMGYRVFVDPMLTGEWNGLEKTFYDFLGVSQLNNLTTFSGKTALLLDPDVGIAQKATKRHVAIGTIVDYLKDHEIVFSFDQSFDRRVDPNKQMNEKLSLLKKEGAEGFYYNSHARFLFSAILPEVLVNLKQHFMASGLPENRFLDREKLSQL